MLTRGKLVSRVQEMAGVDDRTLAERTSDEVLSSLCGRISRGTVETLMPDLPGLILADCDLQRADRPESRIELETLLQRLQDRCRLDDVSARAMAQAVFHAIKDALPREEVESVASQLPQNLKVFWLEA